MAPRFLPRRPLGRTGFPATVIGQGDLADRSVPRERCVAVLRRALDAGVNVLDTAPQYEDGYSEELVGEALRGRRDGVFLVDKLDHLDRPVGPQLDGSLERLGLPSVDLAAFHAVSKLADWIRLAAPGGLLDELGEEVRRGRARFRGLSSHHPDVLAAALDDGRCDVLMFPVGLFVARQYVTEILPRAKAAGVGTICFKTFGAGKLLGDTEGYGRPLAERPRGKLSSGGVDEAAPTLPRVDVATCVRYTLTQDPDVTLLGLSFENEQDAAWAAVEAFTPMTKDEEKDARYAAWEAVKDKGAVWWNPPPRTGR
ncbi:MAG TPA: aldo/keto reductase, partial [Anaeromyxobacteraceae bacterium]|nr:aldo/keto reductase [Anaeromyxobacteraceae bacterium]